MMLNPSNSYYYIFFSLFQQYTHHHQQLPCPSSSAKKEIEKWTAPPFRDGNESPTARRQLATLGVPAREMMIIKARRENRVASILMMLDIRKSSVIHSSFLRLIYYWRAADGKILFFFWRNLFYERKLDWFWYIRNSFIFIRLYRGWLMAVSFLKPPECQRILRLLILPTNDVSLCLYSTYRVAPYCPTENPDTSFVEKKEREKPFFFSSSSFW